MLRDKTVNFKKSLTPVQYSVQCPFPHSVLIKLITLKNTLLILSKSPNATISFKSYNKQQMIFLPSILKILLDHKSYSSRYRVMGRCGLPKHK